MQLVANKEGVVVYDNVLPVDICERLVERYLFDYRKDFMAEHRLMKDNRECQSLIIGQYDSWHRDISEFIPFFIDVLEDYKKLNLINFHLKDGGFTIAGYNPGQGCRSHIDGPYSTPTDSTVRAVTMTCMLNEVEDGGEVIFPKQLMSVRSKPGRVCFFPPFFTHPHFVRPPISGPRFVLLTWWHYPLQSPD